MAGSEVPGMRQVTRVPSPSRLSIVTVPWDDAGPHLRFSVTYEAADEAAEDALMRATEDRLKQIRPVF